ncbi:MAG: DUF692 domain-containing protein [Pseudomonadota bacterium]
MSLKPAPVAHQVGSPVASTLGAGLGLKADYFDDALAARAPGLWWEVHPENYMVDGGPRLRWLQAIRAEHPVSFHSVSLSLGSPGLPDAQHLVRLAALVKRFEPTLISEHLAWSVLGGQYQPDLLPVPRNAESLASLVRNIDCVQTALGRSIAIENPSHYLRTPTLHDWDEVEFLAELHRRTGCTLLLDVNNVFVSANNLGVDAKAQLDRFPAEAVSEIHLAGHTPDPRLGEGLLIDSHDAPVSPTVWSLYERLIARVGPKPTLIERDGNLPEFKDLWGERETTQACLRAGEPLGAVREGCVDSPALESIA